MAVLFRGGWVLAPIFVIGWFGWFLMLERYGYYFMLKGGSVNGVFGGFWNNLKKKGEDVAFAKLARRPYGYFYSLVDMYDQYGFVDKVYSQGPEDYDFSGDWLKDGENYLLTAGACEDGEITSRVSALTLLYKDGKLEIIGESLYPREEI